MFAARRHFRFLRLLGVAAILCGLLLQPVLAALSDLHAAEHASAVACEHGHDHNTDSDPALAPTAPVEGLSGLHGVLHAFAGMSAAVLLDLPFFQGSGPVGSDPPLASPDSGHGFLHTGSPFRPPIA